MNKALTERFMSLLLTEHQLGYNEILIRDPNCVFGDTFNYFYNKCGKEDKSEGQENDQRLTAGKNDT